MDSAEHDPSAPLPYGAAHLVAAQGVVGVDADADNVARLNTLIVEVLQSFIADLGIAERLGGRAGQDVKPSGGDDGGSEGSIAWIN